MTLNPSLQAIIFDMDGLLVDSESVWQMAETEMLASFGADYTAEIRAPLLGMRMDEFLSKLIAIFHLPVTLPELNQRLLNEMLDRIPREVKAQPGALELVAYVQRHNIPCAIASSSPLSIIDVTVNSQGWGDVFTLRCTAEDEPHGKPAPDVYITTARKLGIDPRYCLALEDSPNGARAAVSAGMTCYAVPDPKHAAPAAFHGITPHVFASLHEVLALI